MSMHTTAEWANSAHLNMTHAQRQQEAALDQIGMSKRAHEMTVSSNLNMYDQLHATMSQKVRNSHQLIEKLQLRADSLEASLQKTKASLAMLEQALRDKDPPLCLNAWRLEQREKRPLREQVRDVVEVALEEEKTMLNETQRRLSEAIKRTKTVINELQHCLEEVRADIEQKTHALGVDEMCLRSTERSMHAMIERTPPPPNSRSRSLPNTLKTTRHQVAHQESSKNEVARHQEAERLNRTTASCEDAGKALREENARLVQRCEVAAVEAKAKSEKRLQERTGENQQMKRRLEGELRETQAKIDHTKNTISETKYQMKALEEPMDLTATCASWRMQRATREHIVDPVSTTIHEHRNTILQAQQDLLGHHQSEKSHLKELQDRRDRLREDLADKAAALNLDLGCLAHDATQLMTKTGSPLAPSKFSRSSKVGTYVPGLSMASTSLPSATYSRAPGGTMIPGVAMRAMTAR